MSLINKIQQIERVDALIRRKGTGNSKELAQKLQISERSVFNLIELMIDMGAPIFYCKEYNSFCYDYAVDFSIGFLPNTNNLNSIKGGKSINVLNFSHSLQNFCSDLI